MTAIHRVYVRGEADVVYQTRVECAKIFLGALLLGLGTGLAAKYLRDWPAVMSPAGWGGTIGSAVFVLGCCISSHRDRDRPRPAGAVQTEYLWDLSVRRWTGQYSGAVTNWRQATQQRELIAGALQEAAQRLKSRASSGGEEFGVRVARLTAYLLIEAGAIDRDCQGRDWLRWNNWDSFKVGDASNFGQAADRYSRDWLNDGITPVYPVKLKRAFRPHSDPLSLSASPLDKEMETLATVIRQRYMNSFDFRLVLGRLEVVERSTREREPAHTQALMTRVYAETAQQLITQFNVTQDEWDEYPAWILNPLHQLTALRLLSAMQVSKDRLVWPSATLPLTFTFDENPARSRNDLTWDGGEDPSAAVQNEALEVAIQLKGLTDQQRASLIDQASYALYQQRDQRAATEPTKLLTQLARVGQMLGAQYWSQARIEENLRFAPPRASVDSQSGAPVEPPRPLRPSEPMLKLLGNAKPVDAPRRPLNWRQNPATEQQLVGLRQSGLLDRPAIEGLLDRWYVRPVNHAGGGNCMFGAVSIGAFGSSDHYLTLRQAAIAYLEERVKQLEPRAAVHKIDLEEARAALAALKARDYGQYGALQALSELLGRPIYVLVTNAYNNKPKLGPDGMFQPTMAFGTDIDAEPIWLTLSGIHYDGWLPREQS